MRANIEIQGLDELMRDVKQAGGDATRLVAAAMTNSATKIQQEARKRAPHRTGTLQRSIMPEGKFPNMLVAVNEKYGVFLEEGTGIYGKKGSAITPKAAKVMRFKGKDGIVFTKKVKGIRPKPFFKPGIEASLSYIQDQFTNVVDRIMRELSGR